jgi:tRNA(Met) cytidine acetyltransferase
MQRNEFYEELKKALWDGKEKYYRNLVYIEKKDYLDDLLASIKTYLEVNQSPSVIYAFHPWVSKAKERRNIIKELFKEGKFEDVDYASTDEYLGNTYDLVILDLVDNFQPNYIGRLVDLARGGGLVILYTDNLTENKMFRNSIVRYGKILDIYERRFRKKLEEHEGIFIANEEGYKARPFVGNTKREEVKIPQKTLMPKELHELAISQDQIKVLEEFYFLLRGGKRVISLTAARGRGKSAVTGLGLAGIIKINLDEGYDTEVTVTAPSLYSASQIMEFAKKGLDILKIKNKEKNSDTGFIREISGDDFEIHYKPPDAVSEVETGKGILVIDEAAALGVNFIDLALRKWKKIVLVTTIHGYEGSGKAFIRYLRKIISERKAPVRLLTMQKPLRYAEGDPIEKWLYDALVLNPEPQRLPEDISIAFYETQDKEELLMNDNKLFQVYGILVSAHYRNNPDDLMIMADGVHHSIKTIYSGDSYLAVVQTSEEGELPDNLIDLALRGGTFDGDLIPDRLLKHVRLRDFGKLKGWRIIRIAVVPELQDKGLGSKILQMVTEDAREKGLDWIGSSFMGDYRVLKFWVKNGFIPVHVSPVRNEKYGDFPVVVIKPLSEIAKRIVDISASIFKEKLLNTIHDIYFNMSPQVAQLLLRGNKAYKDINLSKLHLAKIVAFLQGTSPYEASADGIHLLTLKYFWDSKRDWSLYDEEEWILIGKVLQGKPWGYLSTLLGINRTQMNEFLYTAVATMLKKYYNMDAEGNIGYSLSDLGDEFTTR